jgi:hypothetical protein
MFYLVLYCSIVCVSTDVLCGLNRRFGPNRSLFRSVQVGFALPCTHFALGVGWERRSQPKQWERQYLEMGFSQELVFPNLSYREYEYVFSGYKVEKSQVLHLAPLHGIYPEFEGNEDDQQQGCVGRCCTVG